ncbi:Prolyl aminopeptidase [Penicillium ucsense]|uniref:Proline iminopeptidase n=1 Tax=Penicillium ucsense TaxID=2839758 RepID=A0A8J8WH35_9EURO|nr:Prolyl aminopeptidase [Penicillium ucsense]KAF7734549.1 Prolyl aminopeptidase [Penicillium ucsense]
MSDYEHSDPFDKGMVPVGSIHQLYYEQYGKRDGKPVVYLHGGPGGHISKANTVYFNPEIYRVVLFDQRGTGRSKPLLELRENDTSHLLADLETLRAHFKIRKWHMVFGGSWGSTLALLYSQAYPHAVGSLVIFGVFTATNLELNWFRDPLGVNNLFPEAHDEFLDFLSEEERDHPNASYYKRLQSNDPKIQLEAARAWNRWELSIGWGPTETPDFQMLDDEAWSVPHALLEAHYMVNDFWLDDGEILKSENLAKIRDIPGTILHGRHDMVCPPKTAWRLQRELPHLQLIWLSSGHMPFASETRQQLIQVCDQYADQDYSA